MWSVLETDLKSFKSTTSWVRCMPDFVLFFLNVNSIGSKHAHRVVTLVPCKFIKRRIGLSSQLDGRSPNNMMASTTTETRQTSRLVVKPRGNQTAPVVF